MRLKTAGTSHSPLSENIIKSILMIHHLGTPPASLREIMEKTSPKIENPD
jgi:hypothetical protein